MPEILNPCANYWCILDKARMLYVFQSLLHLYNLIIINLQPTLSHNKKMISKTAYINDNDFLIRMLYKDLY